MPRTAQQNQQFWLDMATRYERNAEILTKPREKADYLKRAAAARTHAATYSLPANTL
jgi:hypothetical protein